MYPKTPRFFMIKSICSITSVFLVTSSLAMTMTTHPAAARSISRLPVALSATSEGSLLLAGRSGPLRKAVPTQPKKVLGIFAPPASPAAPVGQPVTKAGILNPAPAATATPATGQSTVTKTGQKKILGIFNPSVATPVRQPVTKAGTLNPAATGQPAVTKTGQQKILGILTIPAPQ
jgi:hypothetical protein